MLLSIGVLETDEREISIVKSLSPWERQAQLKKQMKAVLRVWLGWRTAQGVARDITGDKDSSRANKLNRGWPGNPVVGQYCSGKRSLEIPRCPGLSTRLPFLLAPREDSSGFPRQAVLCGPVGFGVLSTPGCLKLSYDGGSSSVPGFFATLPGERECITCKSLTGLMGSEPTPSTPFPSIVSFLPPPLPASNHCFQTIDLCPLLLGTKGQFKGMERPRGNIENGLSILPSDPASWSLGQDK